MNQVHDKINMKLLLFAMILSGIHLYNEVIEFLRNYE